MTADEARELTAQRKANILKLFCDRLDADILTAIRDLKSSVTLVINVKDDEELNMYAPSDSVNDTVLLWVMDEIKSRGFRAEAYTKHTAINVSWP